MSLVEAAQTWSLSPWTSVSLQGWRRALSTTHSTRVTIQLWGVCLFFYPWLHCFAQVQVDQ